MTIASWLVLVDAGDAGHARTALGLLPGVEVRGSAGGRLVVLSESASGLEEIDAALRRTDGVRDVALASAFTSAAASEEGGPA